MGIPGLAENLLGSLFGEAKTNVKAHTARMAIGKPKAQRAKKVDSYVDWDRPEPRPRKGGKYAGINPNRAGQAANFIEYMNKKADPAFSYKAGWHDYPDGNGFESPFTGIGKALDKSPYTTRDFNVAVGNGLRTPSLFWEKITDPKGYDNRASTGIQGNKSQKWGSLFSGLDPDEEWSESGDNAAWSAIAALLGGGAVKGGSMAFKGLKGAKGVPEIAKAINSRPKVEMRPYQGRPVQPSNTRHVVADDGHAPGDGSSWYDFARDQFSLEELYEMGAVPRPKPVYAGPRGPNNAYQSKNMWHDYDRGFRDPRDKGAFPQFHAWNRNGWHPSDEHEAYGNQWGFGGWDGQ